MGINLTEDAMKWKVNHAHNEKMRARKERKRAHSVAHRATKERGEDTATESDFSDEEEEEEVTLPPLSPSCPTPSPFGDIVGWQVGITMGRRRSKHTRTGTGSLAGMPQQPHPMLVSPDLKG
jgi:hypothetical protein